MRIDEAKAVIALLGDVPDLILASCYTKDGKPLIKHITLLKKNASKKANKYPKYFKQ